MHTISARSLNRVFLQDAHLYHQHSLGDVANQNASRHGHAKSGNLWALNGSISKVWGASKAIPRRK